MIFFKECHTLAFSVVALSCLALLSFTIVGVWPVTTRANRLDGLGTDRGNLTHVPEISTPSQSPGCRSHQSPLSRDSTYAVALLA